jgi:hypothetical protein
MWRGPMRPAARPATRPYGATSIDEDFVSNARSVRSDKPPRRSMRPRLSQRPLIRTHMAQRIALRQSAPMRGVRARSRDTCPQTRMLRRGAYLPLWPRLKR